MFVAMLNPLVTSSIVTGETPVMNMRFTGESVADVAALREVKNCLKNPSPCVSRSYASCPLSARIVFVKLSYSSMRTYISTFLSRRFSMMRLSLPLQSPLPIAVTASASPEGSLSRYLFANASMQMDVYSSKLRCTSPTSLLTAEKLKYMTRYLPRSSVGFAPMSVPEKSSSNRSL